MARTRTVDPKPALISLSMLMVILALMTALLAGCNTTEGLGRDISAAGNGIEQSAQKNK